MFGLFKNKEDKNKKYITDRQHIINKLNIAEIDYSDIQKVSPDASFGTNNAITFEMGHEENFSLFFDSVEDSGRALELIYFKMDFALTDLGEEMNHYYKSIGLDELLMDFKKPISSINKEEIDELPY